MQGERFLLDEKGWIEEAQGVIKEIVDYVRLFVISEKLVSSDSEIFLNLETLEGDRFTIRLDERGFTVVGKEVDTVEAGLLEQRQYETPHSLLDNISPQYRQVGDGVLGSPKLGQMRGEIRTKIRNLRISSKKLRLSMFLWQAWGNDLSRQLQKLQQEQDSRGQE